MILDMVMDIGLVVMVVTVIMIGVAALNKL
jgi:hypothetical protein